MKIILASASPRRRELLTQIGLEFEIITADVEEHSDSREPAQVVMDLSALKAEAVLAQMAQQGLLQTEDVLVLGADTIVSCDGRILGKPKDEQEAISMLERLQDRGHQVYTGMTLLYRRAGESQPVKKQFFEETEVFFYPMNRTEIEDYVASKDPMDKAGSYGIQGFCARYIKGIQGDYNNVVGLPVGRLYQEMKGLLGDEEGSNI
ncbi:MAG: septum formation protein Maf [Lachnospiraceae bacterium]|nr:septum formation protein Maf [Lachnospiraceae bacterium]